MSIRPVGRVRLLLGGAVAVAAIVGPASAAMAQTTSSSLSGTISVSPSKVTRGHTVAFGGEVPTSGPGSCPAGDPVTLTANGALPAAQASALTTPQALFPAGKPVPEATRAANGYYRVDYTVPTKTVDGPYSVGVRCGKSTVPVAVALTVEKPKPTTTGKVFPETKSMMVHLNGPQRLVGEVSLVAAVALIGMFAAWAPRPRWRRRTLS